MTRKELICRKKTQLTNQPRSIRGVVAKVLDCDIVATELKFYSHYYTTTFTFRQIPSEMVAPAIG